MTEEKVTANDDGSIPVTDPVYREHLIYTGSRIKILEQVDDRLEKIALKLTRGVLAKKKPRKLLSGIVKELSLMHDAINRLSRHDRLEQIELIEHMFPILESEEYGLSIECVPEEDSPGIFKLDILSKEQLEEARADS